MRQQRTETAQLTLDATRRLVSLVGGAAGSLSPDAVDAARHEARTVLHHLTAIAKLDHTIADMEGRKGRYRLDGAMIVDMCGRTVGMVEDPALGAAVLAAINARARYAEAPDAKAGYLRA